MTMRIIQSVLLVFAVISFTSCVQKRFIHNASPVLNPLMKDKGEGFVSGYYHTNGESHTTSSNGFESKTSSNGVNFQGGYAFAKNFAIVGSYNYLNQKSNYGDANSLFDTSFVRYNRNEITLAGNFFLTNSTKKSGLNLLLGVTTGKLDLDDKGRTANADYSRYFNANPLQVFLQPCFNIYLEEGSAVGFHGKFGWVSYNNRKSNYSAAELHELRLDNATSIYTAELGGKFAVGLGKVPLSVDGQLNYIINNSNRIFLRRLNASLGVTYRFYQKRSSK